METINKDAVYLQAMEVFKDAMQVADAFISKYHQLEFQDGIRLLSIEEVSKRLAGLNRKEVRKLYDSNKLRGLRRENGTIVIFSDSVDDYISGLKNITHNEYFANEQKVMKSAKAPITRTEIEKLTNKNKSEK